MITYKDILKLVLTKIGDAITTVIAISLGSKEMNPLFARYINSNPYLSFLGVPAALMAGLMIKEIQRELMKSSSQQTLSYIKMLDWLVKAIVIFTFLIIINNVIVALLQSIHTC